MPAAKKLLIIEKRATFKPRFTWRTKKGLPITLTGYTFFWTVRSNDGQTVYLQLTIDNGGIRVIPGKGVIQIYLDHIATEALTWTEGNHELLASVTESNGEITRTRLMQGRVVVSEVFE